MIDRVHFSNTRPARPDEATALIVYGTYELNGYGRLTAKCGAPRVEHIVPPAGDDHAFDRVVRPLDIEIMVSPTGRSTRMWINGVEIDWEAVTP